MSCPVSAATDLLNPAWLDDPVAHEGFLRARREHPVFWQPMGPDDGFWAVLKHADIMDVSSRPEVFSSAHGIFLADTLHRSPGALTRTDPPEHRRLRGYVQDFFSARTVNRMSDWIRAECRGIFERLSDRESVDFIADIALELPLNIFSEMIGVPARERREFVRLANDVSDASLVGGEPWQKAAAAMGQFGLRLGKTHRGEDDLFASMRQAQWGDHPLSDEEFSSMFMQIASAAVDTTQTVMGEMAVRLAEDKSILRALREQPDLARTAVDEFLRWDPPVYLMRRTALSDTELRGQQIKAGQKVVMYYKSANFDEDVFADPFHFDIRRRPNPHLSFGTGEHACLGLLFVRTELRIFLEELSARISDLELDGPVTKSGSLDMKKVSHVPVTLQLA
jgi:cytochrome P450